VPTEPKELVVAMRRQTAEVIVHAKDKADNPLKVSVSNQANTDLDEINREKYGG
jgi:hypothetical protein